MTTKPRTLHEAWERLADSFVEFVIALGQALLILTLAWLVLSTAVHEARITALEATECVP